MNNPYNPYALTGYFSNAKKVNGGYEVQVPDYSKPTGMGGFQTTTQFVPDSAVGSVEVRETPIGFGMTTTSYNLSGVDLNRPATVATQTGLLARAISRYNIRYIN